MGRWTGGPGPGEQVGVSRGREVRREEGGRGEESCLEGNKDSGNKASGDLSFEANLLQIQSTELMLFPLFPYSLVPSFTCSVLVVTRPPRLTRPPRPPYAPPLHFPCSSTSGNGRLAPSPAHLIQLLYLPTYLPIHWRALHSLWLTRT